MELRNDFALLCLYQETQLFLGHLPLVTQILSGFIRTQGQVHTEVNTITHTHTYTQHVMLIYITVNSQLYILCLETVCRSSYVQMGALWSELGFKLTSLRAPSPEPDEILSPSSSSSELFSASLTSSSGFLLPSIHGDLSNSPNRPSPCPSTQVKHIPHPSPDNRP